MECVPKLLLYIISVFEVMKVMGKQNVTFPHNHAEDSEQDKNTSIAVPGVLFGGQGRFFRWPQYSPLISHCLSTIHSD